MKRFRPQHAVESEWMRKYGRRTPAQQALRVPPVWGVQGAKANFNNIADMNAYVGGRGGGLPILPPLPPLPPPVSPTHPPGARHRVRDHRPRSPSMSSRTLPLTHAWPLLSPRYRRQRETMTPNGPAARRAEERASTAEGGSRRKKRRGRPRSRDGRPGSRDEARPPSRDGSVGR